MPTPPAGPPWSFAVPDASDESPIERIAGLFARHDVEFIVIGGQAEALHGSARVTFDIDLCYRRSAENLDRLARALRELKPTLRGAPPDRPFVIDAKSLALGSNFTFDTTMIALDLLGELEPIGGYDEIIGRTETYRVGEHDLKVIGLDDLIAIKQHLGRPKDRDSLAHLNAIKQLRDEAVG